MPPVKSLLIANRGEIAVRVIRTARKMGLRTVALYSEIDRNALHVELAHEAWNIGTAPASDSYLQGDRIIDVARESGADAVHPGYGFLAENASFADAVIEAGLTWVGPPPDAIATMGDKIASRKAAADAGVEPVPGTLEPLDSLEDVEAAAAEFGLPVAIKAAHGGGGKGLRVVGEEAELRDALEGAKREADAYFGSSEVYVERYIDRPRHVEAQIIVDREGNSVFMGERDCSVQRRHQKLIEETPSPGMTEKQRRQLGKAALAVAEACSYENAGTIEFLMDPDGNLFFLEMNTRLQVEHTITEMVTGIDLVQEQLQVAEGEPLSFAEVDPRGHAIEFRINAEDPVSDFVPTPGQIVEYREPAGQGVRVDSWITPGTNVSQYYDNLLAKLVVWGRDRDEAIARGGRALEEFLLTGVATTIPAHLVVLSHEAFVTDQHHTRFLDDIDFSAITHPQAAALPEEESLEERQVTVEVGGRRFVVRFWVPEPETAPGSARRPAPRRRPPKLTHSPRQAGAEEGVITSPMQGTIVKVHVGAGEAVNAGEPICVLEAMKMENEVQSPISGEVVDLRVTAGDTVSAGSVIAIVR
ncbi:MAG: acetyl/propionyl/methylcrotonyl-CoA carboxylase subunit alpha [Acidimicrobiia bacterium]